MSASKYQETMKLACGCPIPEVVITLLGTGKGSIKRRQIQCDLHGPQKAIPIATITAAQRKLKKQRAAGQLDFDDIPPF